MPPKVGERATRRMTPSAEDVERYAQVTGDRNPLHFDEAFVAATPFGRLVVQGGITAGILNALVAEELPGPGTVFMSQQLTYVAPVFVGDTIEGEVEVIEVHATKPVTKLRVEVRRLVPDDEAEMVLHGEAWCYTFAGPA